ncbi:hypothetical protein O181_084596 [Austropuccinia psidii MF-1]|uniref:Cysteine-rich PDZ-binding protein n=1 Tax=Austropuccinia psidii MF-1 TaxID=1389203 RepID=A0A9Q3FWT7_9BASI|nr:hypothetical protein [Austropuccinia psidii MF-1]
MCQRKFSKSSSLATPEVKGIIGSSNNLNQFQNRKIGENKLLTSKNRYTPYASTSTSKSTSLKNSSQSLMGKCLTCKSNVTRPAAKYCQNCAYKKVILISFSFPYAFFSYFFIHFITFN